MDNHVVVGVGNIYANEALFKAGIRPDRACGKISLVRYERLVSSIRDTLARAIEQGGTTLRDFVGGDGKPGYFKQELLVYGKAGQSCTHCSKPDQRDQNWAIEAPVFVVNVKDERKFFSKKRPERRDCQTDSESNGRAGRSKAICPGISVSSLLLLRIIRLTGILLLAWQ